MLLLQYNDKSVITIQRNGNATISPLQSVQNNHIYSGSENELILSQVYTTSFTCTYDMGSYPFDFQKCSMVLIMQVLFQDANTNNMCCHSHVKPRATVANLPSLPKIGLITKEQWISPSILCRAMK